MGFLTRLFSVGKKKRKEGQKDTPKNPNFLYDIRQLSEEQGVVDGDVLFNRLLRSSSTHFSVISEGVECRSIPPIPHPINNVLRAPSVISSATQTETYTVTVHRPMLHSRTEFLNANHSGYSSLSSPVSLSRRPSLSPLTPGDKTRLAKLRQDASVISLLEIYDEQGNPNVHAFSNTPAKLERCDPSLRALMGGTDAPNAGQVEVGLESDISWADRYIRAAHCDSSSSLALSSLGIPTNLFKTSISPERLRLQEYDSETPLSSCEIDVGIDSLQVEYGTVEDTSATLQPLVAALTSPTRRASQFFKFLRDEMKLYENPTEDASLKTSHLDKPFVLSHPIAGPAPLVPHGPRSIQRRPSIASPANESSEDQSCSLRKDVDLVVVRDGPKLNHAQFYSPPRRHSSPVTSTTRTQLQTANDQALSRLPLEELRNAGLGHPPTRNVYIDQTERSISVASSVHPAIETQSTDITTDPYTPLPSHRIADGKRGYFAVGENVPPNAPARPVRGQSRMHNTRNYTRPSRSKESSEHRVTTSTNPLPNEELLRHVNTAFVLSKHAIPSNPTPPATPSKTPAHAHLYTPVRPSPASSSELSPHGRQIMANVRSKARNSNHKTPRSWQAWVGKDELCEV